jgi:hypothetical protein
MWFLGYIYYGVVSGKKRAAKGSQHRSEEVSRAHGGAGAAEWDRQKGPIVAATRYV